MTRSVSGELSLAASHRGGARRPKPWGNRDTVTITGTLSRHFQRIRNRVTPARVAAGGSGGEEPVGTSLRSPETGGTLPRWGRGEKR